MKTERRLYTAGRANGETSRCVDTFPGKAGGGLVGRALAIAALAVAAWCAHGDVWQDCTAWYMGGTDKDNDGVFENGELTDIRHAAIADSPTHGGGVRTSNPGASNRVETVISATSGRTFPNQRVIYLAQIPGTTKNGDPGVKEQDIKLPFAATTNEYTFIVRLRMDEDQFATQGYISVLDLGYCGSTPKQSFYIRYYPETEKFGIVCNAGVSVTNFSSPTNDVCRTMRETWVEMAVTMNKGTMRLGVRAPGMDAFAWNSKTYSFPAGCDVPYKNKVYVGSMQGYGDISNKTYPVRGSVQLMAYWERVLSDVEVEEAFGMGNIEDSSLYSPSILTVGGGRCGPDIFTGATTNDVTEIDPDLQDIAAFPASIEAGRTIKIPFRVLDTCTNLPQQVRLATAADSAAGSFMIKIDGTTLKPISVQPGQEVSRHAAAELFTEGAHTLTITRTDDGAGLAKLSMVEISGSWRVGWVDGSPSELGGDFGTSAGTKTYGVTGLSSNRWTSVRSTVTKARFLALRADVNGLDAASRPFTFKSRPVGYPANNSYDLVMLVNGEERFRRLCSPDDKDLRSSPIEIALPPGTLRAGENEFVWKTVINESYPDQANTWLRLDYFALEIGENPMWFTLVIR